MKRAICLVKNNKEAKAMHSSQKHPFSIENPLENVKISMHSSVA